MTSPEPMTTRELLELAALDAFGLLDDYEAALYTRSFHDAPATVQDEIKRLQEEVIRDESLLPDEQPDSSLRQRVLEAVAKAVERDAEKLAPLATIGRARAAAREAAARFPMTASGQFWRAAAFILAASGLVMAYLFSLGYQSSNRLATAALNGETARVQQLLYPTPIDFLLDDNTKVTLIAVDPTKPYRASLYVNERTKMVMIVMDGLPPTEDDGYILQVVLEDERIKPLDAFSGSRGFGGARLANLPAGLLTSAVAWQITDLTGTVLLSSV